ncbi:MAG: hypothetical protein HN494_07945 [Opitutae bacterium]|jgi:hypothetical protein|nr:hypothetical protein [Opitutae bacterium]MBT4664968.1 hypothetical protein [Opitutae bacterium]MBT5909195.1 hypothetical protein [Opitutae bacterium]MBT6849744.1 hypothetical protein [Opitutae bacterium]MBT7743503.1 hypothetical protein [Opitutae bacterium]
MKKKRQSEPEPIQYRVRYKTEGNITPVVKYFMATSAEQALEMFAYSCRALQPIPEVLDFSEWNRWSEDWTNIPQTVAIQEATEQPSGT